MLKISGYTYTRNAVQMDYPLAENIESLLGFCQEVVIVDASDQNDGTKEMLDVLATKHGEDRLVVLDAEVDWKAPNHAIYDGQMKALARENCTGDFLFQIDTDECLERIDAQRIEAVLKKANYLTDTPLMAFPIVEYWGSEGRVRVDTNCWKWRISRNLPDITHGIPINLRKVENGLLYATGGTDGCDYIHRSTGQPVQCLNFCNQPVDELRRSAIYDERAAAQYENWFNSVINSLPTVFHFSWWNIERKIRQYQLFWTDFWKSMYNQPRPPGWNPFFNKPFDQVSNEEIKILATELEQNTGGWIFHEKWDGSRTNHIYVDRPIPTIMRDWCETRRLAR